MQNVKQAEVFAPLIERLPLPLFLSHKPISSADYRLDYIQVLQFFSKLTNHIIDHMLTSSHGPARQLRKSVLENS